MNKKLLAGLLLASGAIFAAPHHSNGDGYGTSAPGYSYAPPVASSPYGGSAYGYDSGYGSGYAAGYGGYGSYGAYGGYDRGWRDDDHDGYFRRDQDHFDRDHRDRDHDDRGYGHDSYYRR